MDPQLEEYLEHAERYRAVTLQLLDQAECLDLDWRPTPEAMSLGQQFVHVAQAEDFQIRGLLRGEWDEERVRLPAQVTGIAEVRELLARVRAHTLEGLADVSSGQLEERVGEPAATLRSWLWFVLEHEIHHKAQISLYLRLLGETPPFFAAPLPPGVRPDQEFRDRMGGI